jgi:hypothetical protein
LTIVERLSINRDVKKWFAVLSLYLSLCSAAQASHIDENRLDFGRQDHQLHFAVSYGLTVTGAKLGNSAGLFAAPVVSALFVLFGSWAKENFVDSKRHVGDMKANAAGALAGMTFSFAF